jgi:hypothetical protein
MTWLAHVKKTMKSMAGQKKSMGKKWFSHVLKTAKRSYHGKKGRRGGADEPSSEPAKVESLGSSNPEDEPVVSESPDTTDLGGRRRRRGSKKTRRARKH